MAMPFTTVQIAWPLCLDLHVTLLRPLTAPGAVGRRTVIDHDVESARHDAGSGIMMHSTIMLDHDADAAC
jgi:hypothetical protein